MHTPRQILDVTMGDNEAQAPTVRAYLVALLSRLWRDGEGFSGKRPFGSSDWEYDLYRPLVAAGYIEGAFDEDGDLDSVDTVAGDKLIAMAITALGASA